MYVNTAYLGKEHEDIVSHSEPLIVTAVGHYKVHTRRVNKTARPNGRGDYQLIYVAAGRVYFNFDGN